MSVILDALRRAEQERKLGQAPSVQVITQMPGQAPLEQRAPVAVWLLLVTVVVAIAAIAIWLLWRPAPSTSPTPAAVVDAPAPDITQPVPPPARREEPAPVSSAPVPEAPQVIRDARGLNDLDDFLPAPRPATRAQFFDGSREGVALCGRHRGRLARKKNRANEKKHCKSACPVCI